MRLLEAGAKQADESSQPIHGFQILQIWKGGRQSRKSLVCSSACLAELSLQSLHVVRKLTCPEKMTDFFEGKPVSQRFRIISANDQAPALSVHLRDSGLGDHYPFQPAI